MQANSELISKEETLKKLIAIELVFILRLKIRTLIQNLMRPFTPNTQKSDEDAIRVAQINTLLCQEHLQHYLNASPQLSCMPFFIDTLKELTFLQNKKELELNEDPSSSTQKEFDLATLDRLKELEKALALKTHAIDDDYQTLLAFLGKDPSDNTTHILRKSVFAAENLNALMAVVDANPDKIHQIAGMLYDDRIIFTIRFMRYDTYSFFHLMEQFPPSFQSAVNLFMELNLTPEIESNYHLNRTLKTFVKQHQIALINPFKYLLEPQDPVFFYLDRPQYSSLNTELEVTKIKIALQNIKQDQRFITKGSNDHLNQAGIDLTFYLEERLTHLREKLPVIIPNSRDPLEISNRSILYYHPETEDRPYLMPDQVLDDPPIKPSREPSAPRVEKLRQPREKVKSFAKTLEAVLTHFKEDFLAVYGFDGFEITAHKATTDIEVRHYHGASLPLGLAICSFLGLPTRAAHFSRHDPLHLNPDTNSRYEPNYSPNFNFLQLLRNFIGGWVPIRDKSNWQWTPKKKAQIIFLPIKFFIILPIKIISVPLKLFLNILKLFTELLPTVCVDGLRTAYKSLFKLARTLFDYEKAAGLTIFPAILIGLASLAVLFVFVLMNIIKKMGIAWTSPEKSARMAFNYGYKFILWLSKSESNQDLAFAIGVILGFVSILTTAISWAIFLPLTLATLFSYFPTLTQAITGVLHLPFISTGFTALQSSLLSLGTFLGTSLTFGASVSSLAALIGVQVSTSILIASTALAFIAAPFTAIISRLAEGFSNTWARWGNNPRLPQKIAKPLLNKIADDLESALTPSVKTQSVDHFSERDSRAELHQSTTPSTGPLKIVHCSDRDSSAALRQSQRVDRREEIAMAEIVSTTTPIPLPYTPDNQQSTGATVVF